MSRPQRGQYQQGKDPWSKNVNHFGKEDDVTKGAAPCLFFLKEEYYGKQD